MSLTALSACPKSPDPILEFSNGGVANVFFAFIQRISPSTGQTKVPPSCILHQHDSRCFPQQKKKHGQVPIEVPQGIGLGRRNG